jgi:surface antigen
VKGSIISSVARASRSVRVWRTALLTAGALGFALVSMQTTPAAHASTGLHYQRGYYLDNGWYCYGWANGAYHCTAHWHRGANGHIISDNTAWVPNNGATSGGGTGGAKSRGGSGGSGGVSRAPGGIGPWVQPAGYHSYGMSSHGWYSSFFGWCTWYASYRRQDEPLMQLGNAAAWAWNAPRHGLHTGSRPAVGATVVFQPGAQGASGAGHVGHVERVYSNGWFLISEMSFYWNGGGWGRVSFRYVHTGAGVSFIY